MTIDNPFLLKKYSGLETGRDGLFYVYFLFVGEVVVYVGQTKNLKSRMYQHRNKKHDTCTFIEVKSNSLSEILKIEKDHIVKFRPILNKNNVCIFIRTHICVPDDVVRRLVELSTSEGITISRVLNRILESFFSKERQVFE